MSTKASGWIVRMLKRPVSPVYYRCLDVAGRLGRIGTLPWTIGALLALRRPRAFKFVEIGVFKGDNAIRIIRLAGKYKVSIYYVGFDLFEDKDEFFKLHPEDRAKYDTPEYPYFEFHSEQHALEKVHDKIGSVLPQDRFSLIVGDSTVAVPAHRDQLKDAAVIYIDGCHDYDIVSQDWQNVRGFMQTNHDILVVFDDVLYPGVGRLKTEIERLKEDYRVFRINRNQFLVASRQLRWKERGFLSLVEGAVAVRDAISKACARSGD